MAPTHVLVPLDGSLLADEALTYAPETFDRRITVVHVVAPLDTGMSDGGLLDPDADRRAAADERAAALVDRAAQQISEGNRQVETVVETGDPAETILDFVETADVDQVVMCGHGGTRNETARRLLGTVATAVVSEAPVTVTVVR